MGLIFLLAGENRGGIYLSNINNGKPIIFQFSTAHFQPFMTYETVKGLGYFSRERGWENKYYTSKQKKNQAYGDNQAHTLNLKHNNILWKQSKNFKWGYWRAWLE